MRKPRFPEKARRSGRMKDVKERRPDMFPDSVSVLILSPITFYIVFDRRLWSEAA
jgi:hypothetical protein